METQFRNFRIAVAAALLAAPAFGGLFSSDGEEAVRAVRERQVGLFGPAKLAGYKAGVAARADLLADCEALARMVKEKEDRYAEIGAELESGYGMTLSQNYNYSKEDLTLYLVVTNGLFGSSPENPVLRAHRAFISEEDAQAFVEKVASRNAAAEDAAILRRFLSERRRDVADADESLRDRFGIVAGKDYRLDEKTGKLFEIQPLPTDAELKAQREAEARAAADARASARLRAEAERREKAEKEKAEKARKEAEAKARREAELKARREKEAAEARARAEKEAREKAEKARKEAEAKARKEAELKARREKEAAEARAKAEKKAAEARERAAAEARKKAAKARREAERNAKKEYGW